MAGNQQKSGSYGDKQMQPDRKKTPPAGAMKAKGGAAVKGQTMSNSPGARPQKSGSKGG